MSFERRYKPIGRPDINALGDIADVTLTSAASGDYIKFNGSAWVNHNPFDTDETVSGTWTHTAPLIIDNAGGHIRLYESDAADPDDFYLLEVNSEAFNLYFRDNSLAAYTLPFQISVAIGAVRTRDGMVFQVFDSTDTDYLQLEDNGTTSRIGTNNNDLYFDIQGVNTVRFTSTANSFLGNTPVRVFDASNSDYIQISDTGTNSQIQTSTNTLLFYSAAGVIQVLTGNNFRVMDSTNTDYISFAHDGTDANISFSGTTSVEYTTAVSLGLPYGIDGRYSDLGGSTAYGGTIWALDSSWRGGSAGADSAITSVYGIRWLRETHTNADSAIGEGLYLYQNGSLKGGFGSSGAKFANKVTTPASTTTRASLNVPHGAAPSSPVNGDMWTTTAGLYVRINGSTIGPLS